MTATQGLSSTHSKTGLAFARFPHGVDFQATLPLLLSKTPNSAFRVVSDLDNDPVAVQQR